MSGSWSCFEFTIHTAQAHFIVYMVPEHIHIHPKKGYWKFQGWGVGQGLKSKLESLFSSLNFFDCSHDGFWDQLRIVFVEIIACSRLSVSEDDWKSERAASGISRQAGSGRGKERVGEPVSIVLKTSFRPLEKQDRFLCQKCQVSKSPYVQYRVTRVSFTRPHWSSVYCVLLQSFNSAVSLWV